MLTSENIKSSFILFFIAFFTLFLSGVYIEGPFVFADESIYALVSKYGWDAAARFPGSLLSVVPNFLFYSIYRVCFLADNGFHLIAARIVNSIFLAGTGVIFFLILKRFISERLAALFSLTVLISYFGIFSVFFMPESLFFFLFWLSIYIFIAYNYPSRLFSVALIGIISAFLSLTKPHGLVIAGGWAVAIFFMDVSFFHFSFNSYRLGNRIAKVILLGLSFALTWLLVAFLLTGQFQIDPIGSYSGPITAGFNFNYFGSFLKVGLRHLGFLLYFFSFPFFIIIVRYKQLPREISDFFINFFIVTLVLSGLLILMTIQFSVGVSGSSIYDSLERNHIRYYLAALPLFYLPGVIGYKHYFGQTTGIKPWSVLIFFILFLGGVLAVWQSKGHASFVDSPILLFSSYNAPLIVSTLFGGAAFIFAWFNYNRLALYTFVAFIFVTVLSSYFLSLALLYRAHGGPEPKIGTILNRILPNEQVYASVIAVAESADARPFCLQYHLGMPLTFYQNPNYDQNVDCGRLNKYRYIVGLDQIKQDCDWELFLSDGNINVYRNKTAKDDVILYQFNDQDKSFDRTAFTLTGFHKLENWGVWTRSETAEIRFDRTFSNQTTLKLKMIASGPNLKHSINLKLGNIEETVSPDEHSRTFTLTGSVFPPTNKLIISGIIPSSPFERGQSSDNRKVGVGIISLEISSNSKPGSNKLEPSLGK